MLGVGGFQLRDNLLQMVFADDVRGDDQFPLWMLIEVFDKYIFIGRPGRTGDKNPLTTSPRGGFLFGRLSPSGELVGGRKRFNQRDLLSQRLDGHDAVETGVAHNLSLGDANLSQELAALLILHEELGETFQYTRIGTSVPTEENLIGTENAAHTIGGHAAVLQDVEIVVPEFVLDEKSHHGAHRAQETAGIGHRIDGQIGDNVGSLIVLAHLIA